MLEKICLISGKTTKHILKYYIVVVLSSKKSLFLVLRVATTPNSHFQITTILVISNKANKLETSHNSPEIQLS